MLTALSLVRAYRTSTTLELIVLGAFAYAALYCFNATVLTNSGCLPTGLMVLGLLYNAFLCFPNAAFHASSAQHTSINALKKFIQIVCIWALLLVAVPYILLDAFSTASLPNLSSGSVVGAILFLNCSMLGLISSFFLVRDGDGTPLPLDQTNSRVNSRPYQYVCNPMAIAGIGQGDYPPDFAPG